MSTPDRGTGAHRAEPTPDEERHIDPEPIDPEPLAIDSEDVNDFIDHYPNDDVEREPERDADGRVIDTQVQPPL
jgi:hypothetical protein